MAGTQMAITRARGGTLRFVLRFALATALAEALAVTITTWIGESMSALVPEDASGAALAGSIGAMLVTGAAEGAIVGCAQWLALRSVFPALPFARYVAAAVLALTLYWALGIATSGFEPETAASEAMIVVASGAFLGVVLGVLGTWALKSVTRVPPSFVPASALAWSLGLFASWLGVRTVPASDTALDAMRAALVFGAATGFVGGLLPALSLAAAPIEKGPSESEEPLAS